MGRKAIMVMAAIGIAGWTACGSDYGDTTAASPPANDAGSSSTMSDAAPEASTSSDAGAADGAAPDDQGRRCSNLSKATLTCPVLAGDRACDPTQEANCCPGLGCTAFAKCAGAGGAAVSALQGFSTASCSGGEAAIACIEGQLAPDTTCDGVEQAVVPVSSDTLPECFSSDSCIDGYIQLCDPTVPKECGPGRTCVVATLKLPGFDGNVYTRTVGACK